jgi:Methylase involved in ubiquinone/menaquinone biosynthesis
MKRGKLVCLEVSNPELPILKQFHSEYLTFVLPTIGYIGTKDKSAYVYLRFLIDVLYKNVVTKFYYY